MRRSGLFLLCFCLLRFCQAQNNNSHWYRFEDSADYYMDRGKYQNAFYHYVSALVACSDSFTHSYPECGRIYNSIATCYQMLGMSVDAEQAFMRAIQLTPDTGEYRLSNADYKLALARYYLNERKFDKAKDLFDQILKTVSKKKTSEIWLYFYAILGKAQIYSLNEDYESGRPYLEEIMNYNWTKDLQIYRNILGETIRQLAIDFTNTDDFRNAEKLYLSLANFYDLKVDPTLHIASLNDLGEFYLKIYDLKNAGLAFHKAINLMDSLGIETPADRLTIYQHLGEIHINYHEMDLAKKYVQASHEIAKRIYTPTDIFYIKHLLNITRLYINLNQFDSAHIILDEMLSSMKLNDGISTADMLDAYNLMAICYTNERKFDLAESIFSRMIAIRSSSSYGAFNFHTCYMNLAMVAFEQSKYEKSYRYAIKAFSFFKTYIGNIGSFCSSTQQLEILNEQQALNSLIGSLAVKNQKDHFNDSINILLRDIQFFSKGFILNTEPSKKNKQGEKLVQLKELLAKGLSSNKLSVSFLSRLQRRIDSLEKEIRYHNLGITDNVDETTFFSSLNLKNSEAVIDFNRIVLYSDGRFTDSVYYTALITTNEAPLPKFIVVCREEELQDFTTNVTSFSSSSPIDTTSKQWDVFNLVWKPLSSFIKAKTSLYLLPIGLLTKISFAGLYIDPKSPLILNYRFVYLSSLRDFASAIAIPNDTKSAIIAGGIQYYRSSKVAINNPTFLPIEWEPLPFTKNEATFVERTLSRKNYSVKLLSGAAATEASLKKSIAQLKPSIIHLATHGYFYSRSDFSTYKDPTPKQYWSRGNVFLTNGLLFANAGNSLNGEDVDAKMEDGILTSLEISNLDLSKTLLVVLSACETGLGKNEGLEGIYGLQRCLKMAGARNCIVSLWRVPDKETSILMKLFYQNLLDKGMSPADSLQAAQVSMSRQFSPYYWAAFVIIQ